MRLMAALYGLWGRVWIPRHLRELKEPAILHITDTPTEFYSAIPGLIKHIAPRWIIHTGDMADNVKLGLNASHLKRYEACVEPLIRMLEGSAAESIYLCVGNHDDRAFVERAAMRSHIVEDNLTLQLGNFAVGISHYAGRAVAAGSDLCLFGHDMELRSDTRHRPMLLNGLEGINIILPESRRIFILPYPVGTDDSRLGRGKVGL